MRVLLFVLPFLGGCALLAAAPVSLAAPPKVPAAVVVSEIPNELFPLPADAMAGPVEPEGVALIDDGAESEEADEGDEAEDGEGESHDAAPAEEGNPLQYTGDISDQALAEQWKLAPESLGCLSLGFTDEGRLINAQRFPQSADWLVVSPEKSWATAETIGFVTSAIRRVRELHPNAPPLRVNQLSGKEGGYLRPHKSHQSGRDVDLAFYYPTVEPIRVREREKHIDLALNWELIKALVSLTDVQMVLVDRRVQKVLYDHALRIGENKDWLDSIFHSGRQSIVQHARRHRDHFHVRFYNPRAQELGRRITPLLAQRPEQNIAVHKVRPGDTLGAIARRYGSSVDAVRKANRLRGHMLRISQVLRVPLRGPCTRCPVPPPLVVPPRRLPPQAELHASQN